MRSPLPGVQVAEPSTPLPKTFGGLRTTGRYLRKEFLGKYDMLWVNDPTLGVHAVSTGQPAFYDVTDDWRTAAFPLRIRRRIARAEARLASTTATIVCSPTLHDRWSQRYGVDAPVVRNGVDYAAWRTASPRRLPGPGPHLGYIGTLHQDRLDVDLVARIAALPWVGTVHLVGPDCLEDRLRRRLLDHSSIRIHGAVPAAEVPSWMLAMDVLISPHRISAFTLSLDAIKAYEYAASGRPVVATPTSGFTESLGHIRLASAAEFERAIRDALAEPPDEMNLNPYWSWTARTEELWQHLTPLLGQGRQVSTP